MRDNIFGARVGEIIDQLELTQGQVELKTGLSQGHISQIISGKRRPRIDIAIALARALGVSLDWLAGLPSPPGADTLAPIELELLRTFRQFDPDEQALALDLVQALAKSRAKEG